MPIPGMNKMMRDNDRASARRDRTDRDRSRVEDVSGLTVTCVTCNAEVPSEASYITEAGIVCETHFTGR